MKQNYPGRENFEEFKIYPCDKDPIYYSLAIIQDIS